MSKLREIPEGAVKVGFRYYVAKPDKGTADIGLLDKALGWTCLFVTKAELNKAINEAIPGVKELDVSPRVRKEDNKLFATYSKRQKAGEGIVFNYFDGLDVLDRVDMFFPLSFLEEVASELEVEELEPARPVRTKKVAAVEPVVAKRGRGRPSAAQKEAEAAALAAAPKRKGRRSVEA